MATNLSDVTGSDWVRNNVASTSAGTSVTLINNTTSGAADMFDTGQSISTWKNLTITLPVSTAGTADWMDIGIFDPADTTNISHVPSSGETPFDSYTSFWGIRLDIYNHRIQFVCGGNAVGAVYLDPNTGGTTQTFVLNLQDDGSGGVLFNFALGSLIPNQTYDYTFAQPSATACIVAVAARTGGFAGTYKTYNTGTYSIGHFNLVPSSSVSVASIVGTPPLNVVPGATSHVDVVSYTNGAKPLDPPTAVIEMIADSGLTDTGTPPDQGGGSGAAHGLFSVFMRANAYVRSSARLGLPTMRTNLVVNTNMEDVAIRDGVPYVPFVHERPYFSSTITAGTGHAGVIPNPTTPTAPLPSGVTAATYRWSVADLSTSGMPYGLTDWAPHGGSGPHWTSAGVYAPTVRSHEVFGRNNQYHTFTTSLLFDPTDVSHMWLDMGSAISQPFTWMFAAIINSYPTRTYGHYLLDSGKASPTRNVADGRDYHINDGLTYRSLMLYQQSSAILCTRPRVEDGVYVRSTHNYVPRARVMFGVFNGSHSYIGFLDHENQVYRRGTVDNKSPRYFVTGRRQNYISDNLASHMTVFEIRYFNSALSWTHIKSNYRQMAAEWKFNHYNEI